MAAPYPTWLQEELITLVIGTMSIDPDEQDAITARLLRNGSMFGVIDTIRESINKSNLNTQ